LSREEDGADEKTEERGFSVEDGGEESGFSTIIDTSTPSSLTLDKPDLRRVVASSDLEV